jgi:hypothetical protein
MATGTKIYADRAEISAAGAALIAAPDAAAQRTALGIGAAAVQTYPLTTANDLWIGGVGGAPARLAPPSATGTWALQSVSGTLTWVEVV